MSKRSEQFLPKTTTDCGQQANKKIQCDFIKVLPPVVYIWLFATLWTLARQLLCPLDSWR